MNTDVKPGGQAAPNLFFKILNNSAIFLGGEVFYRFVAFFTALWVVRSLSGEEYGQFSFIYVFISFFEVFVQFGFNSILTRQISQDQSQAPKVLGNAILFRLLMCAAAIPLSLVIIRLLDYPMSIQKGVLLASFHLFLTLRAVYDAIFRVQLKMIYPAAWNSFKALLSFAFVVIAALVKPNFYSFIIAYLSSGWIALIGFILFTRKHIRIEYKWDSALLVHLIKQSFPLVLSGYMTLLYYRIDVFMLSKMKGFLAVGYYSVATRLTEALGIIATSLLVSIFPVLSRSFQENREEFDQTLARTFKIMMMVGLPLAVGGCLVADPLTVLMFGDNYQPSAVTLMILLWYTAFFFVGGLLANVLIACGKQVLDAWVSFGLLIANVLLNIKLIPAMSYNGAAIATVIVEILGVLAIFIYAVMSPTIKMKVPVKDTLLVLLINVPLAGFVYYLSIVLGWPVVAVIPSAAIFYFANVVLVRLVTIEQITRYLSHTRRKGGAS